MSVYRIELHAADGGAVVVKAQTFASDDAAIDHAGALGHAGEINVWRGDRLVAHFPSALARRLLG